MTMMGLVTSGGGLQAARFFLGMAESALFQLTKASMIFSCLSQEVHREVGAGFVQQSSDDKVGS